MADWRTDDRELLARILMAEAGNQGPVGMTAVGNVIMNRANTSGYGDGIRGVIMKPGQFSPMNSVTGYAGGEQGQNIDSLRPNETHYMVADALLSGNAGDITGGATHFFHDGISNPSWAKGKEFKRIGDHVFGSADAGRGGPQATRTTQGASPMTPTQTQPQGILEMMGVQRRDPSAQGDTALPFYQRDQFKDMMGGIAMAANTLRQRPDQNINEQVMAGRDQREQNKEQNRTVAYLRANGRGDLADMIAQGMISGKDAAGVMLAKPKDVEYETKILKLADGSDVMVERLKGTNDPWQPSQIPAGGTTGSGAPVKKLTEGQSNLTLFQTLQDETQPVLMALESQFNPANIKDPTMARLPIAGNYFTSPEYQMYQTAAAAWAEGALRIATGAAATQPEIERNIKTYFAQPGDTPQTVAFKTRMREMYSRAVNNALGVAPTGETLPIPTPQDFAVQVAGGVTAKASTAVDDVNSILGE